MLAQDNDDDEHWDDDFHVDWAVDNAMDCRDEKGHIQPFCRAVAEFMSSSSIHGLPRVWEQGHWWRRMMWIVVCLAGGALTVYTIHDLTAMYLSNAKYTDINFHHYKHLLFPLVTICRPLQDMPPLEVGLARCRRGQEGFRCQPSEWSELYTVQSVLGVAKSTRCYQFNSPSETGTAGHRSAIRIMLNLQMWNVTTTLPEWGELQQDEDMLLDEVHVQLHSRDQLPMPIQYGFKCGVGVDCTCSFYKHTLSRLGTDNGREGFKVGECEDSKAGPAKYTREACTSRCLTNGQTTLRAMLMERCECFVPGMDPAQDHNQTAVTELQVCTEPSGKFEKCFREVLHELNDACSNTCLELCEEDIYYLTVSNNPMPSFRYEDKRPERNESFSSLIKKVGLQDGIPHPNTARYFTQNGSSYVTSPAQLRQYIGENFVELELWYSTFTVQEEQELRLVSMTTYLGGIGGAAGLFLGISFMTVFEFVEFGFIALGTYLGLKLVGKKDTAKVACTEEDKPNSPKNTPSSQNQIENTPSSQNQIENTPSSQNQIENTPHGMSTSIGSDQEIILSPLAPMVRMHSGMTVSALTENSRHRRGHAPG